MSTEMVKSSLSAQQIHGVTEVPLEAMLAYGQVILAIVGGDGVVSPAEWSHFEEKARGMGAPDPAIAAWKAFDHRGADVKALLARAFAAGVPEKKTARVMLYDAITMSLADGVYADGERAAAAKAAEWLGIDEAMLRAIEGVVQLEHTLGQTRRAIFDAK